ncbi:hypothetical protein AB8B12_28125, partial [Streptomyces sp. PGLac3x]
MFGAGLPAMVSGEVSAPQGIRDGIAAPPRTTAHRLPREHPAARQGALAAGSGANGPLPRAPAAKPRQRA